MSAFPQRLFDPTPVHPGEPSSYHALNEPERVDDPIFSGPNEALIERILALGAEGRVRLPMAWSFESPRGSLHLAGDGLALLLDHSATRGRLGTRQFLTELLLQAMDCPPRKPGSLARLDPWDHSRFDNSTHRARFAAELLAIQSCADWTDTALAVEMKQARSRGLDTPADSTVFVHVRLACRDAQAWPGESLADVQASVEGAYARRQAQCEAIFEGLGPCAAWELGPRDDRHGLAASRARESFAANLDAHGAQIEARAIGSGALPGSPRSRPSAL